MIKKMMQLCLLLSLLLFLTVGCKKQIKPRRRPVPEVAVVPVKLQTVKEVWSLVGETIAEPKVELLARVKGFLTKRNFKQGAFVKKGELLFQIEKDLYLSLVKKDEAEVSIKEALLKNAEINYRRASILSKKQSISKETLDKAVADRDSALGELNVAKAALQQAKLNLSYTDIKAPFDGRIGLSNFNVGNMIGPESGVLATVVALNPMQVEFHVNEADFLRAKQTALGRNIPLATLLATLDLKLVLSNKSVYNHSGKIFFWNNQVDSSTGTILLRARFENPEFMLLPGQYVTVKIESAQPKKRLVIPQVAVQAALGGHFVMIVDSENTIQKKDVVLGYRFDDMVEVKEGLKEGEQVVIAGIQNVHEKLKVKTKVLDSKKITTSEQGE